MFIWQAHEGAVTSLAFGLGGGILSTGVDGLVKYWDRLTGSLNCSWELAEAATKATSNLLNVLADSSGQFAAVGLRTAGVQFLDLRNGKITTRFKLTGVSGLASAPDGASVFVVGLEVGWFRSSHDSRVFQCDFAKGKIIASSQSETPGGPLAIRPDGKQVIAGYTRFS